MISNLIECNVCKTLKEEDKTCGFCAVDHIINDLRKPRVDQKHIIVPNYDYVLDGEYNDPIYDAYLNNSHLLEQIEEES